MRTNVLIDGNLKPSSSMECEVRLRNNESGYQQLDERKRLTAAKISELLEVLEHPELLLHNNPALVSC